MLSFHLLLFVPDYAKNVLRRRETYGSLVYGVLDRCQSQWTKADKVEPDALKETEDAPQASSLRTEVREMRHDHSGLDKSSSSDDDVNVSDPKWRLELTWLTKAIEPALQVCRSALQTGLFTFLVAFCIIYFTRMITWCC